MSESLEDIKKMANEIQEASNQIKEEFSRYGEVKEHLIRLSFLYAKAIFDCCPEGISIFLGHGFNGKNKWLQVAFVPEILKDINETTATAFAKQLFSGLESDRGYLHFVFANDNSPYICESGAYGNAFAQATLRPILGGDPAACIFVGYYFETKHRRKLVMTKSKLGSGARFKAQSNAIQKEGKSKKVADAITAANGRKKYGDAKMNKMAAAGKARKK